MTGILSGDIGLAGVALAGALVAVCVALSVHYRRAAARARHAATAATARALDAETALQAAPLGHISISSADGGIDVAPRLVEALGLEARVHGAFGEILDAFEAVAGARLEAAVESLRAEGGGFTLTVPARDGARIFEATGARAGAGDGNPCFVWFHDATAPNRATATATAERDALSALLDALPIPIWRRDGDLNLAYCNRAYADAVDRTPDRALSDAIELLGSAQARAARAIAERARQSRAPVAERHHVVIGGARRLIEIEERPVDDGALLGLAIDRTGSEELAAELKRHIAAHANVLESLSSGIAIFGPDLRLKFFNSAYAQLWHLDDDFLAAEPNLGDILEALRVARRQPEQANFPEFKRKWLAGLKTLIDPVEELLHLPDGSTLRSVTTPHPFGGVLFTYEDVTDRLTLERSYNTLIEVQRETLDNLYEGIAVYGADGRLKLFNPAFLRIWDMPAEIADAQPHVRDILERARRFFRVAGDEWEPFREDRVARATEAEARSGRRGRADGTVIDWAQVPLPDGASLFTFLDVTDSIRVERALRERNDALETADRLKSEFIANVSYELRTPLNAIVGFAEILENQFFGQLNDRQMEYSRGIVEASQRLISLINDILDLATIEAGYMELDLAEVDVRQMLESVQTLGHERARTRDIELTVECPAGIGRIEGDARRLRQALFNLLSNAFKFTPEGGRVTVRAARANAELQISVSDTGTGIRETDIDRVFSKFERGTGHSAQAGQSGAGLGLSLVKSLIELHGGRVELSSLPNEGTTVVCHIPVKAGDIANRPDPEPATA